MKEIMIYNKYFLFKNIDNFIHKFILVLYLISIKKVKTHIIKLLKLI